MKIVSGLYIWFFFACHARGMPEEPATEADDFALLDETIGLDSEKDFYPENKLGGCGKCSCPPTPLCEPGVSSVVDGCGCCRICAAQLGEKCDARNVCDHHKGLHCDENTGKCKAKPGRSCHIGGEWYESGALFSPTCRLACSCVDGDLGCMTKCKPAPPGCHYPRLVKSSSNCCGHWRCSSRPSEYARGSKSTVEFRGSCMIQTTNWSPCTKTCGFGTSERVTNNNENCKLTKETRLCIIRPCKGNTSPRKAKRSCRKTLRHSKRLRYSIGGCLATKTYRPRYCGTCRHPDKCCRPQGTKTIDMEFRCENADGGFHTMTRKMMVIQSCECGNFCRSNANELPNYSFWSLGGDMLRRT